ncbi:hypothetical protein JCM10914_3518 [Paenibacillus sp. JCM 10914]|nr:hypothetical protein [Paenibacillus sp. JCM 10914]GAE07297.1 hypothetical protein JCM10914_3518 [Paenibacillus sp. JCM 10914]
MVMKVLRQNRWIVLLLGALLVSLSLISLLGMQTTATEGEEQQDMPTYVMAAMYPEREIGQAELESSYRQDGQPVNMLTTIVYDPWSKPTDHVVLSPFLQGMAVAGDEHGESEKVKQADQGKEEKSKAKSADGKPATQQGTQVVKSQAESLKPPPTLLLHKNRYVNPGSEGSSHLDL